MSIEVKYSTVATACGGRDGHVSTPDGKLDVTVSTPKELGGPGAGTNPEQLFAAGYSACFLSALKLAGQQLKIKIPSNAVVIATVGIGPRPAGGFGLAVGLVIQLPDVERNNAERLVQIAHRVCPYSNATRNNIDVSLTIA
jgi:lipoyl-dependent peroxiredoxin